MNSSLTNKAIALLEKLIATPSFSGQEAGSATLIYEFLQKANVAPKRHLHNVWAVNKYFDAARETIMLNSHHDTVKPNNGYTRPPLQPQQAAGKLFGLGSNDAGGALVSLIATFLHFYDNPNLPFNLLLACTAEEEISGSNGIVALLPQVPRPAMAIVGEPTQMQMAIAEKGLLVLNCTAVGKAGHAARNEGDNAIYKAMEDIRWLQSYAFANESALLGPVKMTVTMINSGSQHNVVPDRCSFTVDVRTTDAYSNEETLAIITKNLAAEVSVKSLRLQPSAIAEDHPLVMAGKQLGLATFGSPTLSDQSLISIPSIKLGPGDSARSHTADEFIYLTEIESGIAKYCQLLHNLFNLNL